VPVRYLGRIERSSPAEGSLDLHTEVQARIVAEAFADAPTETSGTDGEDAKAAPNGSTKNGKANGVHPEPAKVKAAKADLARAESASRTSSKRKK